MSNLNQSILITGGSGFAGQHLYNLLLTQGFDDIHVTSYGNKLATDISGKIKQHALDLTNREAVFSLLHEVQPTQIYHLAAISEVADSFVAAEKTILNNTVLQLNILEGVRVHCPTARVLVIGSGQEYDFIADSTSPVSEEHPLGPANPYGVSKVTQDLLGLSYHYAFKLNIIRVRPFNHTGAGQQPAFAIPSFAQQIAVAEKKGGGEIKVGNMTAIRDITDVKDVVSAYVLLMNAGVVGEVYNVGSGNGYSMQELLEGLLKLSETTIQVTSDPSRVRPLDVKQIIADTNKIKQLGWSPSIPITTTLKNVLDYWRATV
ncbi:MAG: GDP-mannose 4,6-dehydratase [bacterium]|nr:GDP-mannose 4,6-dehydratase [bacterium]